jgi:ABC-type multidrug transport system fused ATPase/permease subunit
MFLNKIITRIQYFIRLVVSAPRYGIIIFISLLAGAFSLFGIPMLIPVLEYLENGNSLGANPILQRIEIILTPLGIEPSFYSILFIAGTLILLGEALVVTSTIIAFYSYCGIMRNYAKQILDSYSKVDWFWLTNTHSGEINYAVLKESEYAAVCHLNAQRLLISTIQCLAYIILAVALSPKGVLMAVGIFAILTVINIYNSLRIRKINDWINSTFEGLSTLLGSFQQNKKFLKTSLLNNTVMQKGFDKIHDIERFHQKAGLRMQLQQGWNFIVMFLFLILIMAFHQPLNLNYSSLLVLLAVFTRLIPQFNIFSMANSQLNYYLPMYESLNKRLSEMKNNIETTGHQEFKSGASIIFKDVHFSYPTRDNVLTKLNLNIAYGKTTALIGGSGAGKSTILDLILGLIKPTNGDIIYGQISYKDLDITTFRRKVAYVGQETTNDSGCRSDALFYPSRNILLGV